MRLSSASILQQLPVLADAIGLWVITITSGLWDFLTKNRYQYKNTVSV